MDWDSPVSLKIRQASRITDLRLFVDDLQKTHLGPDLCKGELNETPHLVKSVR